MRKIKFTTILSTSLPFLLLWFSNSCRSSDTDNKTLNTNPVAISVNLVQDDYEDVTGKNIQASTSQNSFIDNSLVQRKEVPFDNGFSLVAELKPDNISLKNSAQASIDPVAAATPIQRAIKFRVVVYNASGQYDSSYNYSISSGGVVTPDSGVPMKLNGGQNYTFIAYSYNTNVAPADNLVGTNLGTANIQITSGQDLMYYKVAMTPSGEVGAQNNLNIILKHSLSTITVNLNSSLTNGYNITNITGATLGKNFPTATVALNTGAITSTGTASTVSVPFPATPNSNNVAATSAVLINNTNNVNDGTFNITSLTVGPLTGSNISFTGLTIQPGARYTMTIRLVPQDMFIDDVLSVPGVTIKTARINGKTWMRYNLGVDPLLNNNPDITNPTTPGLFGNYYQWGRLGTLSNGFTGSTAIIGWDNVTTPSSNAWNSGSEATPIKVILNDPCPNNYRVPTKTEFQDLINSTTQANTNDASWDAPTNTNYTSIKVFTSKKDKNVILSFPAPGYRVANNGSLAGGSRGAMGIYWTSSPPPSRGSWQNVQLYKGSVDFTSNASGPNYGENIRCIKTN